MDIDRTRERDRERDVERERERAWERERDVERRLGGGERIVERERERAERDRERERDGYLKGRNVVGECFFLWWFVSESFCGVVTCFATTLLIAVVLDPFSLSLA